MIDNGSAIQHHRDCTQPDVYTFTGKFGDQMVQCRSCGRARPADPDRQPARPTVPDNTSRYWCPAHLKPVTAKGRGCPGCEHERADSRARRRNKNTG